MHASSMWILLKPKPRHKHNNSANREIATWQCPSWRALAMWASLGSWPPAESSADPPGFDRHRTCQSYQSHLPSGRSSWPGTEALV